MMTRNLRLAASLLLCLWLGTACAAGDSPAVAAAAGKPYVIYMAVYRGCEEACRGFQDYFRKRGIAADFILRDAAQDASKIPDFVTEAKRLRPDIVVTWGTTVTLGMVGNWRKPDPARHITDLPVIFMVVADPVASGIIENERSSGRNLTGTLTLLPMETQFKSARSYLKFNRVGFIINPTEKNSLDARDQLRVVAEREQFSVIERELPVDVSGRPDASAIPDLVAQLVAEKVDLIYQGPDTFLITRAQALTSAAVERGIPVFASNESPVVNARALFGIVNKYEDCGRYTARQALRILQDGVRPQEIPIELPRHFSYLVNLPVALELGRYPPLKLLDVAEIVGQRNLPR
ncbi:MAG: ABC transporter substrate-binding protein [Rhodocyclaceae bacterium]|nr:ABC transporter substrate-binding protein [Rhodocyclaceae bacterium]MBX3668865.1 ABC transporter substrate-binding protein [Rhodocyclaceae bacterium]